MESLATNAPRRYSSSVQSPPGVGSATIRLHILGDIQTAPEEDELFWINYPGLVWSNRKASDSVRIRAALMRPLFPVLLDIATRFGVPRLEQEWAILEGDPETDTQKVQATVLRILANIRRGYEQARS